MVVRAGKHSSYQKTWKTEVRIGDLIRGTWVYVVETWYKYNSEWRLAKRVAENFIIVK